MWSHLDQTFDPRLAFKILSPAVPFLFARPTGPSLSGQLLPKLARALAVAHSVGLTQHIHIRGAIPNRCQPSPRCKGPAGSTVVLIHGSSTSARLVIKYGCTVEMKSWMVTKPPSPAVGLTSPFALLYLVSILKWDVIIFGTSFSNLLAASGTWK